MVLVLRQLPKSTYRAFKLLPLAGVKPNDGQRFVYYCATGREPIFWNPLKLLTLFRGFLFLSSFVQPLTVFPRKKVYDICIS